MVSSLDELVAALATSEIIPFHKGSIGSAANNFTSLWRVAGQPGTGVLPSTGAGDAPTKATAGAISSWTNSAGANTAFLANICASTDDLGNWTLYDRLVHTSGLNGTVITSQTINSTALTRYTDGVGVEAFLEVYTTLGGTSRTATISYTNQAGVSGRTGTCVTGTSPPAGRMIPFLLEGGDTGVRSIQSLILSATTGVAGDFGVTLVRRLADAPFGGLAYNSPPRDAFDLGMPEVQDDACLALMGLTAAATVGPVVGFINIAQG